MEEFDTLDSEIAAKLDSNLEALFGESATKAEARSDGIGKTGTDNREERTADNQTGNQTTGNAEGSTKDQKDREEQEQSQHPSLARAMKRLSEREAKIEALEKKYKTLETEGITKQVGNGTKNIGLMTQFQRDPLAALQGLGFDNTQAQTILRAGLARVMGDKAPDSYKAITKDLQLEARFAESQAELQKLRDELNTERRAKAERDYVTQYQTEVSTYLGNPSGSETPLTAKLFSTQRDVAMSQIMEIVMSDANEKIRSGRSDAQPLTPGEAAAKLEKKLEQYKTVFVSGEDKKPALAKTMNLTNKDVRPTSQVKKEEEEELSVDKMVDLYLNRMLQGG